MEPKSYDAIFGDAWHVQGSAIRKRFTYLEVEGAPTLTPEFIGQSAYDTVSQEFYTAVGLTSSDWVPADPPVPIKASKAAAQAERIVAGVKSLELQFYAPVYAQPSTLVGRGKWTRMSKADADAAGYPASVRFPSTDKFMPDGSTDLVNGGIWVLDEKVVNLEMINGPIDPAVDVASLWGDIMTYCAIAGAEFRGSPGREYRLATRGSALRTETSKDTIIDLNGGKLTCIGNGGLSFVSANTAFLTTTLAVEPVRGAAYIELTSVAGIAKGDFIEITSPALSQSAVNVTHTYVVSELDGNKVYIEGAVVCDINAQQIIDDGQVGSIAVNVFKLTGRAAFKNGTVSVDDAGGIGTGSIYFRNLKQVLIDNIIADGHTREHIVVERTAYVNVRDYSSKEFGYVIQDQGYVNLPSHPSSAGFGYGILLLRVWHAFISQSRGGRGWHLVDASRGVMHCTIHNCFLGRDSYGVSCHESAWHFNVIDCDFDGGDGVNGTRCAYLLVENCRFRNMREKAISYGGAASNVEVRIKGNDFDSKWGAGTSESTVYNSGSGDANAGCMSVGRKRVFEMSGNTHKGVARVHAGLGGVKTANLSVRGEKFKDYAQLYQVYMAQESEIIDNTFGEIDGQYAMSLNFSSSITCHALIDNNRQAGTWGAFTNSALIYINGSGTHDINVYNNKSEGSFLVRFVSTTIGLAEVIGNRNKLGRMFLGVAGNVVAKCFNNVYLGSAIQTGGVLITQENTNFSTSVGRLQVLTADAAFTLTPYTSPFETRFTGTLTANRVATLSMAGAVAGMRFRVSNAGAGAFTIDVTGAALLKALALGTWGDFTFDGTAWYLSAYGAL